MKNLSFFALLAVIAITSFSFRDKSPAPATRMSKSLAFPVAGKKTNIGDKWGASRGGGVRRHKGIDIMARRGTPVVAIADGYIAEKGTFPVGGKVLWLKPEGLSVYAYYAHLDKWYVKEGQYVRKGQVLGTVGNTGNARHTPSHLHFGIAKNKAWEDDEKAWVNPLPYVKHSTKVAAKTPASKKKYTAKKKTTKKSTKSRRR